MGIKTAIGWFCIILLLAITWRLLDLPPETELIATITTWLATYGTPLVLVGSMLEALLLVGLYFPGSIIIFLGVGLATSPLHAVGQVMTVSLGMLLGYIINYHIGKYGLHRLVIRFGLRHQLERATLSMQKSATRYVFYTFWNPGMAAFTATAAGIVQLPLRTFLPIAVGGILFWNTGWGILVYTLGQHAVSLLSFPIIISIVSIWLVFEMTRYWYNKRHSIEK